MDVSSSPNIQNASQATLLITGRQEKYLWRYSSCGIQLTTLHMSLSHAQTLYIYIHTHLKKKLIAKSQQSMLLQTTT
jgi:hypothetical protein